MSSASLGATVTSGPDLQAAINSAQPGDTILAEPGTYQKVEITKSISLIGDGATITASGSEACVSVRADRVSISGFTVRDGLYGIKLDGVKGCAVKNNTVIHCRQPGIALLFSDNNLVEGNNASYNGIWGEGWYGIYLSSSNNNRILNNTASYNGAYGIDMFPSCNNNTIIGNVLEGNMYGLYMFTNCANNWIERNVMSMNKASGLDMRFNCHHNTVTNNTISQNTVAGISMLDSGENLISANIIYNNQKFGIQIQGSGGKNSIGGNNITGSSTGVYLESGENIVFANRFMDNVIQAAERNANIWNAPYPRGGNLWGDYTGDDQLSGPGQNESGSDGIGDVPYLVGSVSSDLYPLMGERFVPIRVLDITITPESAAVGDNVLVKARLEALYGLDRVSLNVPQAEAAGYALMMPSGDIYQGTLATALFAPGRYDLVLKATDRRGYELEERIGTVELTARAGRDFQAEMARLGRK